MSKGIENKVFWNFRDECCFVKKCVPKSCSLSQNAPNYGSGCCRLSWAWQILERALSLNSEIDLILAESTPRCSPREDKQFANFMVGPLVVMAPWLAGWPRLLCAERYMLEGLNAALSGGDVVQGLNRRLGYLPYRRLRHSRKQNCTNLS